MKLLLTLDVHDPRGRRRDLILNSPLAYPLRLEAYVFLQTHGTRYVRFLVGSLRLCKRGKLKADRNMTVDATLELPLPASWAEPAADQARKLDDWFHVHVPAGQAKLNATQPLAMSRRMAGRYEIRAETEETISLGKCVVGLRNGMTSRDVERSHHSAGAASQSLPS